MMSQRTVCTLFIIVTLEVTFSYAGLSHFPPIDAPENLAQQPGCYSDLTESILPYEKEVTPTAACVKLKCLRNNFTEITTCDLPLVVEGCHIQENNGTFPACCAKVVCHKSKKTPKKSKQKPKASKQKPKASKKTTELNKPIEKNISHTIPTYYKSDNDSNVQANTSDEEGEQTNADTKEYNGFDKTDTDNRDTDYHYTVYDDLDYYTDTDNRDNDYHYTVYDDLDYTENDQYIDNEFVYPYIYRPRQYHDNEYELYSNIHGYDDYYDDPEYIDVDYDKYGEWDNEYSEYDDDNLSNIENEYPYLHKSRHYDDESELYPHPYGYGSYYYYPPYGSYYYYPHYVDYREKSPYKNKYDVNEYDKTPSNKNRYPDKNDLQKYYAEEYEKYSNRYTDDNILYFYEIDDAGVSETENDALTEQKYADINLTDNETNVDSNYDTSTYVVQPNSDKFKQANADTKIEEGTKVAETKVENIVYAKQNNETENEKYTGSTDDIKYDKDINDKNGNKEIYEQTYPESDKRKVGVIYYPQNNAEHNANPTLVAATGGNVDKTTIQVGSDIGTTSTGDKKIDLEQAIATDNVIKETASTGDKKIYLEQATAINKVIKETASTGNKKIDLEQATPIDKAIKETASTGDKKIDLEQATAGGKIIKETASTDDKKIDLEQAAVIDEIIKDNTYIRILETLLNTHGVIDEQPIAATLPAVASVAQNNIAKATASVGRN